MGLLLTTIAGLVLWIVLWAIDVKSFDAFMLTALMIVVAGGLRVFRSHLEARRTEAENRWIAR